MQTKNGQVLIQEFGFLRNASSAAPLRGGSGSNLSISSVTALNSKPCLHSRYPRL